MNNALPISRGELRTEAVRHLHDEDHVPNNMNLSFDCNMRLLEGHERIRSGDQFAVLLTNGVFRWDFVPTKDWGRAAGKKYVSGTVRRLQYMAGYRRGTFID
jgi:hypothetical protein